MTQWGTDLVAAGILPASEPGILPCGIRSVLAPEVMPAGIPKAWADIPSFPSVPVIPGGKMPPSPVLLRQGCGGQAGRMPAATGGFTFIEVLAALVFLGILMPVAISAVMLCSKTGTISERSKTAVALAENQLNELLVSGSLSSSEASGDFGPDWPGYRWTMKQADWPGGNGMTELTMTVRFDVQGQERDVHLTTLTVAQQ